MKKRKKLLAKKVIERKLKQIEGWQTNKNFTQLQKTFKTDSSISSLALTAKITVYAEILDHHPDIELSYGKVKVKLSTHSANGLTKKDFELARKIDQIIQK